MCSSFHRYGKKWEVFNDFVKAQKRRELKKKPQINSNKRFKIKCSFFISMKLSAKIISLKKIKPIVKKPIAKMGVLILILFLAVTLISCGGKKMNQEVLDTKTAVLDTNLGIIKIELFEEAMPITSGNFIELAEKGFYDGTRFHRVISGFMIQGGDPLSKDDSKKQLWGTGGPGYVIDDEFAEQNKNNRGTISMANAGPDTGGSQFFINLVNNNFLDTKHPVFGKVVEGMDIVDKIAGVQTDSEDKPVEDVVINKIMIE